MGQIALEHAEHCFASPAWRPRSRYAIVRTTNLSLVEFVNGATDAGFAFAPGLVLTPTLGESALAAGACSSVTTQYTGYSQFARGRLQIVATQPADNTTPGDGFVVSSRWSDTGSGHIENIITTLCNATPSPKTPTATQYYVRVE